MAIVMIIIIIIIVVVSAAVVGFVTCPLASSAFFLFFSTEQIKRPIYWCSDNTTTKQAIEIALLWFTLKYSLTCL